MTIRKPNALRGLKATLRACLSIICSIALALSLTPAYALEDTTGSSDATSDEPAYISVPEVVGGKDYADEYFIGDDFSEPEGLRVWNLDDSQTQNTLSLLLDADNEDDEDESFRVGLTTTDEVEWFKRVDFPSEFKNSADRFYGLLKEACDNDGTNDYLIDDIYLDSSKNSGNPLLNEFEVVTYQGRKATALVAGTFTYEDEDDLKKKNQSLQECTLAVLAAYDRDHPEVFWLNGYAAFFWDPIGPNSTRLYWLIGDLQNFGFEKESVRIDCFGSEDEIRESIALREKRTQELLGAVGVAYSSSQKGVDLPQVEVSNVYYSAAEKVRFFNKWLTYSNCYSNVEFSKLSSEYPLAFECISALVGQIGDKGPVCEAYSRALKVLCDACDISCVLVDGIGAGGAHMWNSVCIDNNWYAIDVTWNDPILSKNGVPIAVARSNYEREDYFLLGSDSKPRGHESDANYEPFLCKVCRERLSNRTLYLDEDKEDGVNHIHSGGSHGVDNRHFSGGLEFRNDPVLEKSAYSLEGVCEFENLDPSAYASEMDLDFLERKMKYAQVSAIPSYEYTGRAKTPIPSYVMIGDKVLRRGVDYRLDYSDNVKAGTAYMKVIGIGSYKGTLTVPFTITRASISIASVTVPDATYTGKTLTPVPVVKLTNADFKLGTDYVVETNYANNKNAGLGAVSVVVRGIGSCEGATLRVLNFKIYPKKASLKKLTAKKKSMVVKWNKATSAWGTGYQIRYSTSSKFKSGVKNTGIKNVSTAQATIKKLKSKKRYYVSIRVYKTVNGTKYYGAWSASKSIKVK